MIYSIPLFEGQDFILNDPQPIEDNLPPIADVLVEPETETPEYQFDLVTHETLGTNPTTGQEVHSLEEVVQVFNETFGDSNVVENLNIWLMSDPHARLNLVF